MSVTNLSPLQKEVCNATDAEHKLADGKHLDTNGKRPLFVVDRPCAMSKERLDDEGKDRNNEDLEVEGEHRWLVEDLKVAKISDSVVVRCVAHERCMQCVECPYSANLQRWEMGRESGVKSIE